MPISKIIHLIRFNTGYPFVLLVLVCIGILVSYCKKDVETVPPADMGYNYFPDDTGRYVIYEVDSISYDDKSHAPDTTRYLLREEIVSSFLDISGRATLRIERFKKMYNDSVPYDSIDWVGPRIWYANRTSTTAEKVEENIRYIKLVFPSKEGKEWDGNSYNTLGQKYYEIISVDESETINNISFDSVITVQQYKQIGFIQYIFEIEKFARNVGLIYKVRDSLYDGGTADTIGYTYRQKIVSYGK
ncbi:MAG: hypothetical protein EPN85_03880 [Bacteroidetes bacterium]|nr:MAG: hypothetical protein EPN85_03880 [Bacteroidota bacterium]